MSGAVACCCSPPPRARRPLDAQGRPGAHFVRKMFCVLRSRCRMFLACTYWIASTTCAARCVRVRSGQVVSPGACAPTPRAAEQVPHLDEPLEDLRLGHRCLARPQQAALVGRTTAASISPRVCSPALHGAPAPQCVHAHLYRSPASQYSVTMQRWPLYMKWSMYLRARRGVDGAWMRRAARPLPRNCNRRPRAGHGLQCTRRILRCAALLCFGAAPVRARPPADVHVDPGPQVQARTRAQADD